MITAVHAIIHTEDADQARAFFRDVLGLANVDADGGWLILRLPPAELAIHPRRGQAPSGHHELYLACDDIEATVSDLTAKGVEFVGGVGERGFGFLTTLKAPGGGTLGLCQPKHATAYDL